MLRLRVLTEQNLTGRRPFALLSPPLSRVFHGTLRKTAERTRLARAKRLLRRVGRETRSVEKGCRSCRAIPPRGAVHIEVGPLRHLRRLGDGLPGLAGQERRRERRGSSRHGVWVV